jgi:hypothetical protein
MQEFRRRSNAPQFSPPERRKQTLSVIKVENRTPPMTHPVTAPTACLEMRHEARVELKKMKPRLLVKGSAWV